MSSVSINGSDSSLAQFFQKLSSSSSTSATSATAPAAPTVAPANADSTTNDSSAPARGAGGHHHGHGGLFKKVEAAVSSALDAAKSDPNADPNKVVEDAIAKVFKDNGGAGGAVPAGGTQGANGPDGDGDHDGGQAAGGTGDASAARQAFSQTLSAFGISASQFHSDFLAAVQDAQGGGSPDSSSLFKDFPPGSNIDTTA